MNEVPIGATWELVLPNGDEARVWLEWRDNGKEWWGYSWRRGGKRHSDHATSLHQAAELCRLELGVRKERFRRRLGRPKRRPSLDAGTNRSMTDLYRRRVGELRKLMQR